MTKPIENKEKIERNQRKLEEFARNYGKKPYFNPNNRNLTTKSPKSAENRQKEWLLELHKAQREFNDISLKISHLRAGHDKRMALSEPIEDKAAYLRAYQSDLGKLLQELDRARVKIDIIKDRINSINKSEPKPDRREPNQAFKRKKIRDALS